MKYEFIKFLFEYYKYIMIKEILFFYFFMRVLVILNIFLKIILFIIFEKNKVESSMKK